MTTIKDIAQNLGISPSTVSIVLRGNGEKRNISKATIERVFSCAQELNYQPNITAKRLRDANTPASYTISVFWSLDFRAPMLVRFLRGLQNAISESGLNIDFFVKQYENNSLEKTLTSNVLNMFHGAIVCNASEKDLEYIENTTFIKPIVLYNRRSQKYSTVSVDDYNIGKVVALEFKKHNCHSTAIIASESVYAGMAERTDSYMKESQMNSIFVTDFIRTSNSITGGYEGGKQLLQQNTLPDCVFCISDAIAIGFLYAINESNISVPGQMKMISIGNGDRELEEFSMPALSVVRIPIEKMAENCLTLLMEQLPLNFSVQKKEIIIETPYIPRKTCPEIL